MPGRVPYGLVGTVRDSDLRLIVLTAAPGSVAAGHLDLLATIGLQRFG